LYGTLVVTLAMLQRLINCRFIIIIIIIIIIETCRRHVDDFDEFFDRVADGNRSKVDDEFEVRRVDCNAVDCDNQMRIFA